MIVTFLRSSDMKVKLSRNDTNKHGLLVASKDEVAPAAQRSKGNDQWDTLKHYMDLVLNKISSWDSVVLTYEPVWATGTGKVASLKQAEE
ncbi:triosephosphate isomerase, chloroplastic, partial [Tanacetum coccineum]